LGCCFHVPHRWVFPLVRLSQRRRFHITRALQLEIGLSSSPHWPLWLTRSLTYIHTHARLTFFIDGAER
jgi:hypothetical protein